MWLSNNEEIYLLIKEKKEKENYCIKTMWKKWLIIKRNKKVKINIMTISLVSIYIKISIKS